MCFCRLGGKPGDSWVAVLQDGEPCAHGAFARFGWKARWFLSCLEMDARGAIIDGIHVLGLLGSGGSYKGDFAAPDWRGAAGERAAKSGTHRRLELGPS